MIVSFNATKDEMALVNKIVARAQNAGLARGKRSRQHWYDALTLRMDLLATHSNGCPLDFQRLLDANDFNFVHDIAGIARHMNRENGSLDDNFRPRFARREAA